MNTDLIDSNAPALCSGCKQAFPPDKLGRMARVPLALASLFHLPPGDEGERFYCPRCRTSQNLGMITLVVFGFAVLVGTWRPSAAAVTALVWLGIYCLWLLFRVCRAIYCRVTGAHLERIKPSETRDNNGPRTK